MKKIDTKTRTENWFIKSMIKQGNYSTYEMAYLLSLDEKTIKERIKRYNLSLCNTHTEQNKEVW